ncbi:hypothetical protein [Paroceanicella profunda]|nr:hypothetical protein [Paroceanicella profunda]
MAKGQNRSGKESKKPKQVKGATVAPIPFAKSVAAASAKAGKKS